MSIHLTLKCRDKPNYKIDLDPSTTIADVKSIAEKQFGLKQPITIYKNILDKNGYTDSTCLKDIPSRKGNNEIVLNATDDSINAAIQTQRGRRIPATMPPTKFFRTDVIINRPEPANIKELVNSIKEMGFSDELLIRKALRISYYKRERALDYLLSGYVPDQPTTAVLINDNGKSQKRVFPRSYNSELNDSDRKKKADYLKKVVRFARINHLEKKRYPTNYMIQLLSAFDWNIDSTLKDLDLLEARDVMENQSKQ